MALRNRTIVGKRVLERGVSRRVFGVLALTSFVVVLVAGAVAFADIPDDGVLHACYDKESGRLRVVDNKGCHDDERKITWSVKGPEGPRGPAGADGERGPTGPAGPSDRRVTRAWRDPSARKVTRARLVRRGPLASVD